MQIQEFKKRFKKELLKAYQAPEISSFFNALLQDIANMTRLDLALNRESTLSLAQQKRFETALKRLQNHEPLQYIIGKAEFYGLSFKVDSRVLIPRPETEELVDWVYEDKSSYSYENILDIGTGSGCIAVTLAKKLPETEISAVDVSMEALQLARENAERNKAEVDFFWMDVLHPLKMKRKFDIIVSNPPYVRQLEKKQMASNVLNYEPHLALFVEDDTPLLFYRKILEFAKQHLSKNGWVYFEVNEYLEKELISLFQEKKATYFYFKKDMYHKIRMAKVKL